MQIAASPTRADAGIDARIIRFRDLVACTNAFIDTRTPGSDRKENFCLVGPGVAENPHQHIHIRIPHGFNIGGARQPSGCKNSHHSHDTEEVFVVHAGRWKFTWGADGTDGSAVLGAGDTISLPVNVFRGFENIGDDAGFLFAVLGGDDPGHVTWSPYVFEHARKHGMVLLRDGRLVDTAAGELVPAGAEIESGPDAGRMRAFRHMSAEDMAACVLTNDALPFVTSTALCRMNGVSEASVLGPASPAESTPAGRMGWKHGFHVRRLRLVQGATVPAHTRAEEEVIFVHRGSLRVNVEGESRTLGCGDLLTTPIGAARCLENAGEDLCDLIVVRGGDAPTAPLWREGTGP